MTETIDSGTWRRPTCPLCADAKRDLASLQSELDRHIAARNQMAMHAHAVAARLEALRGWRAIADELSEAIPPRHKILWRRLTDALEVATGFRA